MNKHFVAVNYINCLPEYQERFEFLFCSRAKAIDQFPRFIEMHVLRPNEQEDNYLIVSYWTSEDDFKKWTNSAAFLEGHKRGFADLANAKAEGMPAPMSSKFKTYQIITN